MNLLTGVYPPRIKPVRDGLYLATPEYFLFGTNGIEGYSLWRFSEGEWRTTDGAAYRNPMYWVGLAFDPTKAEPSDKWWLDIHTNDHAVRRGYWIPKVCDE